MEKTDNLYIYSKPKVVPLIANYIDKAGILAVAATATTQIIFFPDANIEPIRWGYVLLILVTISLTMEFGLRIFAYKITIDTEKSIIQFELLRSAGTVKADINKINAIEIGFYISFIFDERRVLYNEVVNKELVSFLKTLKPILWRPIGRFIYKHW